jgi:uncharacterized membrane protein
MTARLFHAWDTLRSSYWFLPSLMLVAAIALAFAMLELDRRVLGDDPKVPWVYLGGAEGARAVLGAIASSVITVAGVVFSITIVTLAQAASQFGPRILRQFMRDRGNQTVLGTFIATFVYCVLILRTVRGENGGTFVPHASVALAVVLAVASIVVLVYFIHHVSVSLQAPIVVAALTADLEQATEHTIPRSTGEADDGAPPEPAGPWSAISAPASGYVQRIDFGALVAAAAREEALLRAECDPGAYAIEGAPLVSVTPAGAADALTRDVRSAFILGPQRTSEQDVRFALQQGVEIAVRALSLGINDPFTAINCVDWLGSALARVGREPPPATVHRDRDGVPRVIVPMPDFGALMDTAFGQLRQYAGRSPAVIVRMLDVLGSLAVVCAGVPHRAAIGAHAARIVGVARLHVEDEADLAVIEARHAAVVRALGGDAPGTTRSSQSARHS